MAVIERENLRRVFGLVKVIGDNNGAGLPKEKVPKGNYSEETYKTAVHLGLIEISDEDHISLTEYGSGLYKNMLSDKTI